MSSSVDRDVRDRAVTIFLNLIIKNNKRFGNKLLEYRKALYGLILWNIQRVGVHSYAEKVLKLRSPERRELVDELERIVR